MRARAWSGVLQYYPNRSISAVYISCSYSRPVAYPSEHIHAPYTWSIYYTVRRTAINTHAAWITPCFTLSYGPSLSSPSTPVSLCVIPWLSYDFYQ